MNTEDDGARGDAEQRPQQSGADQDNGRENSTGGVTPPPAEPPVEPPPADQPSAEQLGAETAETVEPGEPATPAPEAATPSDDAAEPAGTEQGADDGAADEGAADERVAAASADEPAGREPRSEESWEAPRETPGDEYARRFLESVDGFLGSVFREASDFVDRTSRRQSPPPPPPPPPPPRQDRERSASDDYASRVLDSLEGWMGDFFRGASMARTAAGFGRAAAGSAFRTRPRADDVWAQATSAQESDASRECRYCPFCQTMAVVRNSRPELYEQIGDTAKTLVDLVRQAAEQSRRPRR